MLSSSLRMLFFFCLFLDKISFYSSDWLQTYSSNPPASTSRVPGLHMWALKILCVCMCVCTHICMHMCPCAYVKARAQPEESVLSCSHVSLGDWIQIIRVGSRCLYLLAHGISYLNVSMALLDGHFGCSHFTDEDSEIQRGQPRAQNRNTPKAANANSTAL